MAHYTCIKHNWSSTYLACPKCTKEQFPNISAPSEPLRADENYFEFDKNLKNVFTEFLADEKEESPQHKIKSECEALYATIETSKERLAVIRKECTHINTHEGIYSYRIGVMDNATICSDCGECLKIHGY